MTNYKYIIYCFGLILFMSACSDLEEEIIDKAVQTDASSVDLEALLDGAYTSMRTPYQDQTGLFSLWQHTSDEAVGPTRGGDWDDNGIWRVMHTHTWDADHAHIRDTYQNILTVVFNTSNILTLNPTAQQEAEARFLRAFAMYTLADGWDQVPFRDGETLNNLLLPPNVVNGTDAIAFVISEVNAIMNNLPDGPAHRANKDAAKVLLMKCYLNNGVFANRSNPTFDNGNMQQVSALADEIINSGNYSFADGYFENFTPDNDVTGVENIFTAENIGGVSSGNLRSRWYMTIHYNMNPSGWNGFTTLSDFYDSFEETDIRRGGEFEGQTNVSGTNIGFLVGQQYNQDGTALEDRRGNPLAFTRDVALVETGENLEVTGIRALKYAIDYEGGDNADNDYVYYRYADVWLMKAEAEMRMGNDAMALEMVNTLRAARGASALTAITLDDMLAERGRELWWECQRRSDLIRFGKFLDPWQLKSASGEERLLFPIPATILATNPNLVQNPGY